MRVVTVGGRSPYLRAKQASADEQADGQTHAIDEAVDFVVISGDLFDGDWKDMGTGLYFARAMGRLDQARIPVFLLAGNHDAASVLTRSVPWPPNVRLFSTKKPQTHLMTSGTL